MSSSKNSNMFGGNNDDDDFIDITGHFDLDQKPKAVQEIDKWAKILRSMLKITALIIGLIAAYATLPGLFKLIFGIAKEFYLWADKMF